MRKWIVDYFWHIQHEWRHRHLAGSWLAKLNLVLILFGVQFHWIYNVETGEQWRRIATMRRLTDPYYPANGAIGWGIKIPG